MSSKRFSTPSKELAPAIERLDRARSYSENRLNKRFERAEAVLAGETPPPEEDSFTGRLADIENALSPEQMADFLVAESRGARPKRSASPVDPFGDTTDEGAISTVRRMSSAPSIQVDEEEADLDIPVFLDGDEDPAARSVPFRWAAVPLRRAAS
jgi:hypothetical protein